jgi:adenine-specific DNA methylase
VASALPEGGDFWGAFERGVDLSGVTVLDPFVGGGTSIVEAQRLGARCLGVDVDPVAVAVTSFQARLHELPDLSETLRRLTSAVGAAMLPFYEREDGTIGLHHFWVQTLDCRECGRAFDAHPHYLLAAEVGTRTKHALCHCCGEVHEVRASWRSFRCRACGERTDILSGTVRGGEATCPHCGASERLIDVAERTGARPRFRLFAVETVPLGERSRSVPMAERRFVPASREDQDRLSKASQRLAELLADGGPGLPDRVIPYVRSDDRPLRYGYARYLDMFCDRQKLHLLLLSRAILDLPRGAERDAMAIAFSDHLKANCMLASYAVGYRRLSPLFAVRAFRHIPRPVELNPWSAGTGRGSFPNAVRQISRAAAWAKRPAEFRLHGGFTPPRAELRGEADIRRGTAACLGHVGDGSVDLVLTDPPYFDNISYSELADFFLPWQRHLGLVTDCEDGLPTDQLAAFSRSPEAALGFGRRLAACFQEVATKMRVGALGAFTYQHSTVAGWSTLAKALAPAPLQVVTVFPLAGDAGANLHRRKDSICWDAVLVLRRVVAEPRRADDGLSVSARALERIGAVRRGWEERLRDVEALPFRRADALNLERALLVAAALSGQGLPASDKVALSRALEEAARKRHPAPTPAPRYRRRRAHNQG